MDRDQLQLLGLTKNEAAVYLALLDTGETKTGALVKKTQMHRVLIYDALESLIQKGLSSYVVKENRKYFQAADPQRLVDFLREKEDLAQSLLPQLQLKAKLAKTQQRVTIYEGIIGLKSALNNMLKELSPGGTHCVFASGHMALALGSYYDLYQNTKRKNRITTKVIYDESFRPNKEIIGRTAGNIRFYPLSPFPTDTWIYNDKVLIVTYTAEPPIAILIMNKQTAISYKKLFEGFWKQATN